MLLRRNVFVLLCCFLTVLISAFFTNLAKSYLFDRFDYDLIRKDENVAWSGPKEGEKIELTGFKDEQSKQFPQLPEKSLILFSLINPKCGMCKRSADLIEQVRDEAKLHQVKFFMVSVASDISKEEFFEYAKTFGKLDGIYSWENEKELVLPALQKMVIPSFILVSEQGVVLRRFPGTSNEKTIRDQMARQIITETLAEKAKLE